MIPRNRYYPLFLDISGRGVLVIGGGSVALRKIRILTRFGAAISVVAIRVVPGVRELARKGKVTLSQREFRHSDLDGKEIVFAATGDKEINQEVSQECGRRNIWVNVVDDPSLCSFIVPAIVRRGDVSFAISTGGSSPALAKFLRKKVETTFGKEFQTAAKTLRHFRGKLLKLSLTERRKVLKPLL
ncbi:MAG: bifunctional precorrin-2 dehydrogenase/sirohydrochlorin ferrochelatase, partial [Elusimicrobia bacterium]|nr:bifunctional precorrin-2 dehydrogenase/sirohydrochlorin ferrochelatase [Elusimicrobiota bacterium]